MLFRSQELERLNLIKADLVIENNGKVTVDEYVEKLKDQGITQDKDITNNGDGSKKVITDNGYTTIIKPNPDNKNDIIIEIEGGGNNPSNPGGEDKPGSNQVQITDVKLTTKTTSIKVDVNVQNGENVTYKYYYKADDEESEKTAYEGKENTYTITGLRPKTNYTIRVEAISKGVTVEKEERGRTEEITNAEGVIEFGEPEWKEEKAEVTITKTTED